MDINPFERELACRWLEWDQSPTRDRAHAALSSVKRLVWYRGDRESIAMVGEYIDAYSEHEVNDLEHIFTIDCSSPPGSRYQFHDPQRGSLGRRVDYFLQKASGNEIDAVYTRAYVYANEISPETIQRVATHVNPRYVHGKVPSNALQKGQDELVQLREILTRRGAKLVTLGALCVFAGIGAYSFLEKTHFIEDFRTDLSNTLRSPELMINAVVEVFESPWMTIPTIAKWAYLKLSS